MIETIATKTPFGFFEISGHDGGITRVQRVEETTAPLVSNSAILMECKAQLTAYFDRKLQQFDVSLDWGTATDFNQSVWRALLDIPYGHTRSYSAIANAINNEKAVRAVGLANKHNPIAIIVPCHRVIAKSGHLHGYFYGLDMKRRLLELENPNSFAVQASLF